MLVCTNQILKERMNNIKKHAFFIPTTRQCNAPIESALEEISQYSLATDESVDFVLLEQNRDETAVKNEETLNGYRKKYPNITMHHIYADDIDRFCISYLVKTRNIEPEDAVKCFDHVYSYGMTYNRIFVIAALLGADYIHRRDSDVYTQHIDGKNLSPFEMEMKYLGKELGSVSGKSEDSDTVYMVGGAYRGNWPISYQDIAEKDISIVYKLIKNGRPDQTDEEIADFVQKKMVRGCSEVYDYDKIDHYSKDMVEVGSQAIYKLFKYLPIPPAEQTSGLDYMINFLLECSESPIVYHNRRVHHVYTGERQEHCWNEKYHIGLAEYRAWYPVNKKLKTLFSRSMEKDYEGISEKMVSALDTINWSSISSQQKEMLYRMSALYKESGNQNYIGAAAVIENNVDKIISKVKESVNTYKTLLVNWASLMDYASGCSLRNVCRV